MSLFHNTQRCLLLSPSCRVFGFLFISSPTFFLSGLDHIKTRKTRAWVSKRPKTASIIRTTDLSSKGVWKWQNVLKVPARWSVNHLIRALQYHSELSVFLGRRAQKTVASALSSKSKKRTFTIENKAPDYICGNWLWIPSNRFGTITYINVCHSKEIISGNHTTKGS